MRALRLVQTLCVAVVFSVTGCGILKPTTPSTTTFAAQSSPPVRQHDSSTTSPSTRTARAQLTMLPIKGRAPKTGYGRSKFGRAWTDEVSVDGGRNGCNTRDDILNRDLTKITLVVGTCKVASGTLDDPYTGRAINFVRGQRTSVLVQIDHLVALADAWEKGAQQWTPDKRLNFANDPRNLQAVDGSANRRKGAGDAATWLPPNKAYRCTYVSRQIAVKVAYGLWVTKAEHDAMERVLAGCR